MGIAMDKSTNRFCTLQNISQFNHTDTPVEVQTVYYSDGITQYRCGSAAAGIIFKWLKSEWSTFCDSRQPKEVHSHQGEATRAS